MEVVANATEILAHALENQTYPIAQALIDPTNAILGVVPGAGEKILELRGSAGPWALAACILALLSFLFFSWRLWRFTITPWMNPDEPREIPYWIPYLGHTLDFFNDSHELLSSVREYLLPDDRPFAITLTGQKFYIITSGRDATAAFENTIALSWEPHLKDLMLKFGVERSALAKIWGIPTPGQTARYANPLNPNHKSLVHFSEDIYRRQLLPGDKLDDFSSRLLSSLDTSLRRENVSGRYGAEKFFSLMDLCANVSIRSITETLLGDLIYDIEPDFTQVLCDFNEDAWKIVIFPHPKYVARNLENARQKVFNTLLKYTQSPLEKRKGSSWLIDTLLEEQQAAGLNDENKAALTFMLLWAANINVYRLSFWMLSYILHDQKLLSLIQGEIAPAFNSNTVNHLHIYDSCSRLTSLYNECLRLTFGSFSVRDVTSPITMCDKKLQPGNTVMIPIRALHYNETAFGDDPDEFNAERFLHDPSLEQDPNFRPFAGGATYCPGRFLAKRMTLSFVATVLNRYEVEIEGRVEEKGAMSTVPEIDQISPTLGIMAPVKGSELFVRLKERKQGWGENGCP